MIYEVDWRGRAAEVAGKLVADGALTDDSPWRAAFEQIPRHLFVPKFWALDEHNTLDVLVDGAEPAHYDEWLGAVYSDRMLVTRYVSRDGFRAASSSSSTPSLVARMLRVLDVHDGHRVLEIGTGTGYTTALLCHRLVDADVVSIDIDPALITEAADRLAALDYLPQLVPGDGAVGYRDSDPYDRILATCASPGVPAGWIEQLADGAVIVAPFALAGAGALAVLTKAGPMEVSGRGNPEPAFFMPLRPYADVAAPDGYFVDLPDLVAEHQQHTGPVDIGPDAFTDRDFRLWLALHFPAGARVIDRVEPPSNEGEPPRRTGGRRLHRSASRRRVVPRRRPLPGRAGPAAVFDHVALAWREWQRHGCPPRLRIGITARADGTQYVWLDTPDSPVRGPSWLRTTRERHRSPAP